MTVVKKLVELKSELGKMTEGEDENVKKIIKTVEFNQISLGDYGMIY